MQIIDLTTEIHAPAERCFLLSLSIDLHIESTAATGERAIAGVTRGLIGPGQRVTWRGRHFGVVLTHESLITIYEAPHSFQDVMVRGAFRSFVHDHWFAAAPHGSTLMRDRLRFAAPLWPLGLVAERLVLGRYLERLLAERNRVIKRVAEGPPELWSGYIQGTQPDSSL